MCGAGFPDAAALTRHCGGLYPDRDDEPYYCACGAAFCSPQALAAHCEGEGHVPEEALDPYQGLPPPPPVVGSASARSQRGAEDTTETHAAAAASLDTTAETAAAGSDAAGDDAADGDETTTSPGGDDDPASPEEPTTTAAAATVAMPPSGYRRLSCPRCARQFASEAALKNHCGGELPDPDDDEPHWCSCGRAFCSARALVSHYEATGHAQELDRPRDYDDDDDDDIGMSHEDMLALDDDNYRRGLSDQAIAALPRRRLLPTDDVEDPITKEKLTGPDVIALACGHVFDETMLLKWFETNRTCPVCRCELEE